MNSFFNSVNDWLLVGGDLDLAHDLTGQDFATTVAQLRGEGVTHVLDLRSEWEDKAEWVQGGLAPENYCHAPIKDSWRHTPAESWHEAVENFVSYFWMNSAEGDRLYVHCHMGINRAPSAAMQALLTIEGMDPWEAFLAIREARPAAGLVYAEAVGARHIVQRDENYDGDVYADIAEDSATYAALADFVGRMQAYWTPQMIQAVRRGMAYYRDAEGGTKVVNG